VDVDGPASLSYLDHQGIRPDDRVGAGIQGTVAKGSDLGVQAVGHLRDLGLRQLRDPKRLSQLLGVGRRLKGVGKVSCPDHDDGVEPVLTFEELAEAVKHAPPPTDDDVSITWDGRVINTKEKLLAVLREVEANHEAGVTYEELCQRPGAWGQNGNWSVDWDWNPVTDPRV